MEEKKLVPQTPGALANPSVQRKGFEEPTSKEDLLIPRAKLLQAMSPEVVAGENDSASHEPLRPGMIINSLTKQVLPGEFVPVFKFTNWVRFNPRNTKDPNYDPAYGAGDVIWRSNDPLDPRVQEEGKFGPNGEVPLATKFINFFCFFPGVNMPVILSFSKTSFKAGKRLLSLAQFSGRDMFATKYKVASKQETGDAGTYFILAVDQVGLSLEDELGLGARLWEQYSNKPIEIHEEALEETGAQ